MAESFDYERLKMIWARIEWQAKWGMISHDEVYRALGQVLQTAGSPDSHRELTLRDVDVEFLFSEVRNLSMSLRTRNALSHLKSYPHEQLFQLIQLPEETILGCPGGQKALEDLKQTLGELGLALGTKFAKSLAEELSRRRLLLRLSIPPATQKKKGEG